MSASNFYPPGGSPDELRETIGELMAVVELRAGIVRNAVAIRDDAVLAYGLRLLTAELRAALFAGGRLAEIRKEDEERRLAADEAGEVAL